MATMRKQDIEQKLAILNRYGFSFELDWTMGHPRVVGNNGSRDVSPRLSKKEMGLWLDGFEQGLYETERKQKAGFAT